jgi:uncharacterized membrane protein YfhO
VSVNAQMKCRGMVIVNDVNFPGWTVSVDGKDAALLEPFGTFRGVVVDAGSHRLDFRYRPQSVYLGLGLSVMGLFIAGWLAKSRS